MPEFVRKPLVWRCECGFVNDLLERIELNGAAEPQDEMLSWNLLPGETFILCHGCEARSLHLKSASYATEWVSVESLADDRSQPWPERPGEVE